MDLNLLMTSTALIVACVSVVWLISLRLSNAGIADIWWGPGFAVIAWTVHTHSQPSDLRLTVVTALLTIWALRLGGYLAHRNLGHSEDKRYVAMRIKSKHFWLISLFKVFILQGLLQIVVATPVIGLANSPTPMSALDWAGGAVAAIGIGFEALADWQLSAFKSKPSNNTAVMRQGLWGWSRHPNYFGNALMWMGIGIVAVAGSAPLWTLSGPALMWFLLLRVSGVSLLESTITNRRPDYVTYIREVSAFIPLPPKRLTSHTEE